MNLEESDPGTANLVWEHTFKVIRSSASQIEVNSYNSAAISMNGTGWKQAGDLNENGKLSKIIRKMVRNLQNEILPGKKEDMSLQQRQPPTQIHNWQQLVQQQFWTEDLAVIQAKYESTVPHYYGKGDL